MYTIILLNKNALITTIKLSSQIVRSLTKLMNAQQKKKKK